MYYYKDSNGYWMSTEKIENMTEITEEEYFKDMEQIRKKIEAQEEE